MLKQLLTSIGLYGLLSFNVGGRTQEIGIRIALGAQRRHVIARAFRECFLLVIAGVFAGLIVSAIAVRVIESMVFGVAALDPLTVSIAVASLIAVATVAAWLPARRAAHLDPLAALRHE